MRNIFNQQLSNLVNAEIVFGSPRRDCRNLGICKIKTSDPDGNEEYKNSCLSARANILIDTHGRLLVLFPKEGISEAVAATNFRNDSFRVEDAYTLTPRLCRLLGYPGGRLTITPGNFPVIMLREGYLLSLPLLAVSAPAYGREEVFTRMLEEAIA